MCLVAWAIDQMGEETDLGSVWGARVACNGYFRGFWVGVLFLGVFVVGLCLLRGLFWLNNKHKRKNKDNTNPLIFLKYNYFM